MLGMPVALPMQLPCPATACERLRPGAQLPTAAHCDRFAHSPCWPWWQDDDDGHPDVGVTTVAFPVQSVER